MKVFLAILIAFFGFTHLGCAWAESSTEGLNPSVAILPIQNEADPLYTLCEHPSDITRLADFVREQSGRKPKDHDAYNAAGVKDRLTFYLGKALAERGYRVYMGADYENFYRRLAARGEDVTYAALQQWVPANAFLLVNIEEWDSSNFETQGILRVAYTVYLIDPKQAEKKGIVWSRSSKDVLELEHSDFLVNKRYEEIIRELARVFLRGLPKSATGGKAACKTH